MKIAVDAFGGDNAPDEVIKGSVQAVAEYNVEVVLTGDVKLLAKRFEALKLPQSGITLVQADGIISIEDDAMEIRNEKKNSSMGMAFQLVTSGQADAFVSAGSTAALVIGGTMLVGRIKGVKRPALAPIMPGTDGNYILLDGGANLECRADMLLQFATLGSIYMSHMLGCKEPRVGLLNVGTESEKGRELEHGAYNLLSKSKLNFIGNIEAREAALGGADVLVTDGFSGNIYLKTIEGMGHFMKLSLKGLFFKNLGTKIAALITKKGINALSSKMDYREVGGSPLLGTARPVIKAHGSSDAKAFKNAIRQAKEFCECNAIADMAASIKANQNEDDE